MSPTVREKEKNTPIAHTCDICIIGGSCTGVFAAVQAARLGAKVAIVENNGYFGGTATAGLVNIWHSIYSADGSTQIINGLTYEMICRLQRKNSIITSEKNNSRSYYFNSSDMIIELDDLVTEQPGIRPFLHARFVDIQKDGPRITHAIIEDKTGRRAIKADYFIDATGDGDLISKAEIPFTTNRTPLHPASCAVVYGLETLRRLNPNFNIHNALSNSRYPESLRRSFFCDSPVPGIPGARTITGSCINSLDCTDADQLTIAEIESRHQIRTICDILQESFPGGEKISLARLPASISVRESRHASCLHTITEHELIEGIHYTDAIANSSFYAPLSAYGEQDSSVETKLKTGYYQIPYRSLVPKDSENVIVAGRLLDVSLAVYTSLCVMINCNQTGEAAGTACVLALDSSSDISTIDTNRLRETMKKEGSIIF